MILGCKVPEEELLPERAYEWAMGYDIKCPYDVKKWDWKDCGHYYCININTKLAVEFDKDYGALLMPRSGLDAKYGIFLIPKVIDPDYRGEIKVKLITYNAPIDITKYTKIAQLVFVKRYNVEFVRVNKLNKTLRNKNGFGSTGLVKE